MRELSRTIAPVQTVAPAVLTGNNTGSAIDLQGFESATLVVNTGAIAGSGAFSIKLQESDTTSAGDFADVSNDDLIGALPASLAADSIVKQGYIGHKRYLRTVVTRASGTSIALGAVLIKGHAHERPIA